MFKRTKVCAGVLVALSGGLVAGQALAQQTERIEVTGSRIKTFETDTSSPVVTIGAEAIKIEGVRNAEQLLNNLPQVFAGYGGQVSNGATGTATVNLRGLGSNRTLVLVNGRRLPAGSPRFLSPDLNQIPVSLVKRVEVLTGGASGVYGSDAVSGVVNFIMNDRFEGLQLEVNHQFYNHKQKHEIDYALDAAKYPKPGSITSDGEVTDVSLTIGGNFANNKGNATLFLGYKKTESLLQSERDFSACSLGEAGDVFSCGGSSTSYPGRFRGIGLPNASRDWTLDKTTGAVRKFSTATDLFNFGPINYFQRPADTFTAAGFARYDINEMARVYMETSMHDDHTVAQIAPSGLFGVQATINDSNPLLTSDWRTALQIPTGGSRDVLFSRRNFEGGGRQDDIRHTSFRFVTGIKGDIGAWNYDASFQTGKVIYQETYKNDFSVTRASRALDVVTDPSTGLPACASYVDGSDPSCVPYNIWKLGGVTQAALDYLQTPGFQKGFTSQNVATLSGGVDLGSFGLKSPMASSGLGLAFGIESRQEKMDLSTDTAFTTGDLAGQGGPTIGVGGGYSVRDIYAELKVPLMDKQPLAELLALNASARNSKYSTGPSVSAYGMGLEWAPIKEVKLRGSAQKSVRAADIIELYSAQSLGLFNMAADPCAGDPNDPIVANRPTATLAQCQNTGVTAAQYGTIENNPAGQYNAIFGGNPQLKPETANSYTLGLVVQPLKDMNVTLDYFNIKIKDAITALSPTTTLQQCLDGNTASCGLIKRDQFGSLWIQGDGRIVATNVNIGKSSTSGFDIGVDYRMKLESLGTVDVSLLGTALKSLVTEPIAGSDNYDCAGYFGTNCGTPNPKWRHRLRTTWTTPWDFQLGATWRYFGAVDNEVTSSNPQLAGTVNNVDKRFAAMNYIDVSAAYNLTKGITLRAAITNLFDKDPPLAVTGAPFGNGNTYPVVYDALGRRISLNLTAQF